MIYPEWNVNGICQEPGVERTTQVTSLAEVLKDHGYHTIHCGKAHFGAEGTPGADMLPVHLPATMARRISATKQTVKARWLPYPVWRNIMEPTLS